MPETVNIALLGAGIWVREQFLPAIVSNPSVTLKAVYSRSRSTVESLINSQASLKSTADAISIYTDEPNTPSWEEILTRDDIHGIIIALPIVSQPSYVKKCIAAGKNIISEKPISPDSKSALELINYYNSIPVDKRGMWGVTEDYRYYSSFNTAVSELNGSSLGGRSKITTFHVAMNSYVDKDNKYYNTPWRKEPGYMGGFILDGGVHYASGIRLLLGDENPVVRVSAFANLSAEHLPPLDTLNATLLLKNGVSGTFSVAFSTGGNVRETVVQTSLGVVKVNYNSVDVKLRDGKQKLIKKDNEDAPGKEIAAFAESIRSGKLDEKLSIQEAYKDLLLLECMLKSAEKNGEPVDVPQDF